jgi:Histidine kinase-, DNA gyrase B-, and HSP90-like ATPase
LLAGIFGDCTGAGASIEGLLCGLWKPSILFMAKSKPRKSQIAAVVRFTMPFEPRTVDHLGLQLYGTLPPVISELVSNAYDAESKKVEITLPVGRITPKSEVIVRDYGHGLSATEVQAEFLPIGRPRRGEDGKKFMSRNKKVRVTGRKGLGKLSAFGVATEMEVRFIREGTATCLRLNYEDLRKWPTIHRNKDYEPQIVSRRTGATSEPQGLEIRLRKLHRKRAISADEVRKGLARRLSMIGHNFVVSVNGQTIKPGDRVLKKDCAQGFSWDISEIPIGDKLSTGDKIGGWIGFLEKSLQTNRGIDIFAHGKAAELSSFFRLSSTHAQFARAHIIGEIHADCIDEKEDHISTARNTVVWDSTVGIALQKWGQAVLKWAFDRWVKLRRKDKETKIINVAGFSAWLDTRLPTEQRVARRILAQLIDDDAIDAESATPLLEIVKGSVESVAFGELIDDIERNGANAVTLLRLFKEWRVIEAREHLRRADGRLAAMTQLHVFIKSGALEVQEMQPLFEQYPWLIDTGWSEADGQTTYTKLLRKHCIDREKVESDRRLDILGIKDGGAVAVVELKRPQTVLSRKHLRQIEDYVVWARANLVGTGADAPKYVTGLLVVGRRASDRELAEIEMRLGGMDIRVETFGDLYERAKKYYGFVEKQLEDLAPEYTRRKRKTTRSQKRKNVDRR